MHQNIKCSPFLTSSQQRFETKQNEYGKINFIENTYKRYCMKKIHAFG